MQSMKTRLGAEKLLSRVITSTAVDALLETLQIKTVTAAAADREEGLLLFGLLVDRALGVFSLNLIPPGPNEERPYLLSFEGEPGARTGFRLAVSLNEGPQRALFDLIRKLPAHGLVPAVKRSSATNEWLEAAPGTVQMVGTGLHLVLQGQVNGSVELRLSPKREAPDDVIVLAVEPATVLIGSTGFGLEFTHGIVIDMAEQAAPAQPARVEGVVLATPADAPGWRGMAVNQARFYLPKGVPFLGGHAVDAVLQVGLAPTPGISLVLHSRVPPQGERPQIEVRIECLDPTATGLDDFVPTLVEAVMALPLKGRTENFGQAVTFGAGVPVQARLRYARKPAAAGAIPSSELSLALESQGDDGLLKVDSAGGGLGAKIMVTAATLATALIADGAQQQPGSDGDGSGVILHTLLVAAVGLSSFLEAGQLVLHRAELMTTGGLLPVGKAMRLKIDYSVAATVTSFDVGVMSLGMKPNQPLRVRVREVVLSIDPEKSGLEMIHLDYARSSLEVEDPGGWMVHGPDSLFDVLGTRSGRGSMWIEIDLRFKLDLGPVKVSGATIRATLDAQGRLSGELRGLDAALSLAGVITGEGAVQLTDDGFRAALEAVIVPLGLGARADVETDAEMVKLSLGVDLPGPLPLGSSGLAIYGIGGVFAANGRPKPVPPGADPIQALLDWDYTQQGAFVPAPAFSFGLEAVIGTAPDLGFTFSARAGLFLTTPDIVVRGSLEGRFLGPRMKIARGANPLNVLQAKGVIVVDPADGVTVAVEGKYEIPHVLSTTVPVGAHFPLKSADWFIHLGADGWAPGAGGRSESREGGPVRSVLLPDILNQTSDAYLMFRGNGITRWPRGGPLSFAPGCYVAAFGFGFDVVYGLKPVLWANVFARADILVATHPMSFVGMGTLGGGLHVGPFSVGVDASVQVVLVDGAPPYFKAEICGTIDLFFDEIRKCVTLHYNNPPVQDMPAPTEHPLDGPQGQSLVDDRYRKLGTLATQPQDATPATAVWPDSLPLLSFTSAPTLALAAGQFPDAAAYPEGLRARPIGSDLLRYDWHLLSLSLIDATGADVLVAGPMSCAWLDGKIGDAAGQPQPAELALLTPCGDLWLNALGDAGAGLAAPPLAARSNICRLLATARRGWALGAAATPEGEHFRLPPDPRSTDPLQSQVQARVQLRFAAKPAGGGTVLDKRSAQLMPLQFAYAGPRVRAFDAQRFDDREFDAWLDPGAALLPPGSRFGPELSHVMDEVRIELDDALIEARVWLVVERAAWAPGGANVGRPFTVQDDLNQFWLSDAEVDLGQGWLAVAWQPPTGLAVRLVRGLCPAGLRLGVLAIGGITLSAAAAAAARNAAAAAEAAKQAQAAANGPAKPGDPPATTRRTVLQPGRLYRIDVEMAWSGTLWEVDDQGNKKVAATQAISVETTSVRPFWFRTAPLRSQGAAAVAAPRGTGAHFAHVQRRLDLFDPAMLERHLLAYEPAQSELQRFAHDPVRVSFAPGHVAALAGVYQFELRCVLRRLDQPEAIEPDLSLKPKLTWLDSPVHLAGAQAQIASAYLDSPCGLAPNGVVLQAAVKLTRDTWYEVFVQAKSKRANVQDGRLPGVSFRTSRWADGPEMLAGLGLPQVSAGKANGGIALRPDAPLVAQTTLGDDGAFDAFMASLGLDGWPVAEAPRISVLWIEGVAGWLCAGLLVESPEAIHRPGRFEADALRLSMGSVDVPFNVRLRDRSGSRLLLATSTPFTPRRTRRNRNAPWQAPVLRLQCRDLPIGRPAKALEGRLELPLQPSFAEEA